MIQLHITLKEAIVSRIMRFAYTKSEENVRDMLTKPVNNEKYHYLIVLSARDE
jgi:hypothetical protein